MIKVSWWRSPENFYNLGDEITSIILDELFEIAHEKSNIFNADLISTGSILNWVYNNKNWNEGRKKISIVGSGLMSPVPGLKEKTKKLNFLDFHSVRGHLTRNLLGFSDREVSIGDPGLLASNLITKKEPKCYNIGVIPHHSQVANPIFLDKIKSLKGVKVIDFKTRDHHSVFAEIQRCEVILSQSLHGLIFSDSLGVPNAWLDAGKLHAGGEFKFYDYFSSIGRDFEKKIDIKNQDLSASLIKDSSFHELSRIRLSYLQNEITSSFRSFFDNI